MTGQLHASGERLETAVQRLAEAERRLEVNLYALHPKPYSLMPRFV